MRNESTNNAIKKVGDQPSPASSDVSKQPEKKGKQVDPKQSAPTELLPTHIDNRELTLGIKIEIKTTPDKKLATRKVLNNLSKNPQYYSDAVVSGKINNKEVDRIFRSLFDRDSTTLVPTKPVYQHEQLIRDLVRKMIKEEIKEMSFIIYDKFNKQYYAGIPNKHDVFSKYKSQANLYKTKFKAQEHINQINNISMKSHLMIIPNK